MILVTAATGMFGSGLVRVLSESGVPTRALVHTPAHAADLESATTQVVAGDMDDPATLVPALEGIDRVFLNAPMDLRKGDRLNHIIDVAAAGSRPHIVLLTGGVQHDDALGDEGRRAQQHLADSGLAWTHLGPQTVMESNFLPQAESVREMGSFVGCVGSGRVGMVALDDVVDAFAAVLTSDDIAGHAGTDYVITGPEAVTFAQVAESATRVLGRPVRYDDMAEDDFRTLMVEVGAFTDDNVDVGVIWHMRAMREGRAALVTDDFRGLTGRSPRSIDEFFSLHRDAFST